MILTTKARYAVMAIIDIAENNSGNSGNSGQPTSLVTISERQKISLGYLEQIFSRLRKAGLVESVKGPGGGYVLAKKSEMITIDQVIKAMDEPIKMTRCGNIKKSCINTNSKCKTHHLWNGLENKIYEYLNSISLSDICK